MDNKNSVALRKKRELLGSMNKRKMSLRKYMDNLKQNECRLDITQITKCVFLGSLALKPVPQLFDSPLLFQELDMKVGNVRTDINDENNEINSVKKGPRKRNLNVPKIKKKSLREKNDLKNTSNGLSSIKDENTNEVNGAANIKLPLLDTYETDTNVKHSQSSPNEENFTLPLNGDSNIKLSHSSSTEENFTLPLLSDSYEENDTNGEVNTSINFPNSSNGPSLLNQNIEETHLMGIEPEANGIEDDTFDALMELEYLNRNLEQKLNKLDNLVDFKRVNPDPFAFVDEDDAERMKREPTPEIVLVDSDEDAIDQLMYNIMDIKVGPLEDFYDMPPSETPSEVEENENYPNKQREVKNESPIITKKRKYGKRRPQCKICSRTFSSYVGLKKHKQVHDGDKPYPCLKCRENYPTLDQLIAHLRIHQGKRPYVCKKCNQGFKTARGLDKHKPVHVLKKVEPQKRTFKCDVCSKEFRKLCDLERHTRVHTGEKPVSCNICNKRFQQAYNLNKHLLIHTQEKPFECDVCHKRFGRNDVLNRHLLTHSLKKPNCCEVCKKSFIRVQQLLAHKEKHHPKVAS